MKTLLLALIAFAFTGTSFAKQAPRMSEKELSKVVKNINKNFQKENLRCGKLKTIPQTAGKVKKDEKRKFKPYKGGTCYGKVSKQMIKDKNGKRIYQLRFTDYNCGTILLGLEKGYGNSQYEERRDGALRGYKMGREGKTSTIVTLNKKALKGDKDSFAIVTNGKGTSCVEISVKFK